MFPECLFPRKNEEIPVFRYLGKDGSIGSLTVDKNNLRNLNVYELQLQVGKYQENSQSIVLSRTQNMVRMCFISF